ncbi:MAG: neutral zinc metallopeptidase [Gammaproteobacteria bacterium]
MRWERGRRSKNVDDRRGQKVKRSAGIGGGAIIMALVAIFLLNKDPATVMQEMGQGQSSGSTSTGQIQQSAQEQQVSDFVSVVLADTEDVWDKVFANSGQRYPRPVLVLYRDSVETACGLGRAASGPFYCPGDRQLYLDLSFLEQLQKMGAGGDFALAYVVAHEVGHHVQTVTGVSDQIRTAQSRAGSKAASNQIQVRMELQADCYAGMWARQAHEQRQILEEGDIEEGLRAAASVGDDHIQKMAGRRVVKEAFTHGSSEERMYWFKRGLESGDVGSCDTFSG